MSYLELRGLRKMFASAVALDNFSLDVAKGEFVSFLGPSGCGKTTTLRIIAGFAHPDAGEVRVDGRDVTPLPPARRNMGMVFQAYGLFPNLSAAANIGFGLQVRHRPAAERSRRVGELLDLVGLTEVAHRYPHEMSGGQQQRVALARALAIEPSVLLLDEPLSALDAKVRVSLRTEIRRIQTRLQMTTIYVTHDQEEALSISDRVVVMSKGRIEQVGTPLEVYQAPSTLFTADFVGAMNRVAGVVQDPGVVEAGGRRLRIPAAARLSAGTRVQLLIRPESAVPTVLPNGAPPADALSGRVAVQTFLGATTRLTVEGEAGDLTVDVPSARAREFPIGSRIALRLDADAVRAVPDQP
ncbi:MAG TPA: ABC transporter ATP-binding protein [Candidatus Limnocylindrales bacterium]|nr:ABC transporter ATP-binding protein [Candidatus Limnocylindrales bacterium]